MAQIARFNQSEAQLVVEVVAVVIQGNPYVRSRLDPMRLEFV